MEKEIILTCSECGHTEQDDAGRALMAKVRMFNHVSYDHPALIEYFRDVIEAREKEFHY